MDLVNILEDYGAKLLLKGRKGTASDVFIVIVPINLQKVCLNPETKEYLKRKEEGVLTISLHFYLFR